MQIQHSTKFDSPTLLDNIKKFFGFCSAQTTQEIANCHCLDFLNRDTEDLSNEDCIKCQTKLTCKYHVNSKYFTVFLYFDVITNYKFALVKAWIVDTQSIHCQMALKRGSNSNFPAKQHKKLFYLGERHANIRFLNHTLLLNKSFTNFLIPMHLSENETILFEIYGTYSLSHATQTKFRRREKFLAQCCIKPREILSANVQGISKAFDHSRTQFLVLGRLMSISYRKLHFKIEIKNLKFYSQSPDIHLLIFKLFKGNKRYQNSQNQVQNFEVLINTIPTQLRPRHFTSAPCIYFDIDLSICSVDDNIKLKLFDNKQVSNKILGESVFNIKTIHLKLFKQSSFVQYFTQPGNSNIVASLIFQKYYF